MTITILFIKIGSGVVYRKALLFFHQTLIFILIEKRKAERKHTSVKDQGY